MYCKEPRALARPYPIEHEIAILFKGSDAGEHTAHWDASTNASGIYFYRVTALEFAETKKMVLLK